MRAILTVILLVGAATSTFAQEAPTPPNACWPVSTREQVVVTRDDGTLQMGTLLCMSPDQVILAGSPAIPLSAIRKIEKPRDGIADGFLKGAAVGLLIFALCGGECEAEYLLRGTLGYALVGGTIDALHGNNKTIYRKDQRSNQPAAAIAWRVRF